MKRQRLNMLFIWALAALAIVLTLSLVYTLVFIPQQQTLAGTPAAVPGDDWPTYLHDAQRTAASGEVVLSPANAGQLTRRWFFKTGGGIAASASVVNNTVYIGSWDGYEYALDALTGFLKWKTYLGITTARCTPPVTGVTSSAAVENNIVYVGGGNSYWYALDAFTGTVLWKIYTGDTNANKGYYNWSSPLIYKGFAYIGIASDCDNPLTQGELLKVDLSLHQVVKSFKVVGDGEVGGGIWTTPALDATTNTIYVTTGTRDRITQTLSQAMISLDATTLTMKGAWQIPLAQSGSDDDWGNTPVLFTDARGHKMLAASNKNGFTYAFDRSSITAGPVWERQTSFGGTCPVCGESSVSSGTFANGTLYMAGGHTIIDGVGYPGALRAIDPGTGKYLWEHGVPNPIIPALAYAHGLIIAGEGTNLEVFNAANGTRLFSYQTGDDIYAAPSVSHGEIFIGSLDGNVYAFSLRNSPPLTSDSQCPSNWSCQDIGAPKVLGSESFLSNKWNILASGAGITDISDQFRFINQSASGDTQIAARVMAQSMTSAAARTGLMLRQNTDQGSPFYAILLTPNDGLIVEYRTAFDGALNITGSLKTLASPYYLEIQRTGDQYLAAVSSDGTAYTLIPGSTVTLIMPNTVVAGLAVASGVNGTIGTATFSGVTIGRPGKPPTPPASATPCPDGWSCSDVGNPALVGDQVLSNGTWSLKGAGKDIWGVSDQFHFAWKPLAANSTVSAHVLTQEKTDALAKAGVMLRTSTNANSPYYSVFVTPGQGIAVQYRSITGLDTLVFSSNSATAAPVYLRVSRWNNIFTAYTSSDGHTWTFIPGSSVVIDAGGPMLGGLMVTAHNTGRLSAVTFDSVSTVETAVPAPTICPQGWNCADIGYAAPNGGQLFNLATSTWTVQGGGFDIFFNKDQFHYVWQALAGDGSISAHVLTQSNTDAAAKAGIMLRASTDISSPYYAVFVTPNHGLLVHFRLTEGGETNEIILPTTYKAPIYLKIDHTGNVFSAYTSPDSVIWTPIPGSSVAIDVSGPILAGLAVTSHNSSFLGVATFDSVNIQ